VLLLILILVAAVLLAPALVRRWPLGGPALLALVPALGLMGLAAHWQRVAPLGLESWEWIPGLDVSASFRLDGLSMLMASLVLGIGALIVAYSRSYLAHAPQGPRFYATLFAFMTAMLGLVLADNVLLLFVFWELTSVTSFLLIGYDHEEEGARRAAFQGLFVTVAGGLVMLAGLIVLGAAAGSYQLSDWLAQGAALGAHADAGLALLLILGGCLTKSAQFPFHFWLPNAMAAPTPVSAYLHSATMVKAGVFLLARLHPVLGEHPLWGTLLVPIGALTALFAAWMAYRAASFKRVLAYTTVMALGTLTLLLGLNQPGAALGFLLAHAFYKGALFMVAGILTHETGAKDLHGLAGQRRALPWTFAAALLAGASAAGLMPWFGFIAKELLLAAAWAHAPWLAAVMILTAALVACQVAAVALRPFLGAPRAPRTAQAIHEPRPWMLAGPVLLATGGLALGLFPDALAAELLAAAAYSAGASSAPDLGLWHGVNPAFIASLVSLALGLGLYLLWPRLQPGLERLAADRWGPEAGYAALLRLIDWAGARVAQRMQSGYLRRYVAITLAVGLGMVLCTLLLRLGDAWQWPALGLPALVPALVGIGVLVMAVAALAGSDALRAVLLLGAVGFGIALLYLWFSAPDLAITQVLVETLTAILLVLVLFRLPRMRQLSSRGQRLRDAALAITAGGVITAVLWQVLAVPSLPPVSGWLTANSVAGGHGRNVVNVILVDFRALDTLGEIFVLALAAVGGFALLRGRRANAEETR
jgi:multicomponent Na+:H+ antiporter subunit A